MCDKAEVEEQRLVTSQEKLVIIRVHAGVPPTEVTQISDYKNVWSINNYSSASIETCHILSDVGTGNDDTLINDENFSIGNFNISGSLQYYPIWECVGRKLKMLKINKFINSTHFLMVITKGKQVFMFQGATIKATLQFDFLDISYTNNNLNCRWSISQKDFDIWICFLSGKMNLLYAMLSSECF